MEVKELGCDCRVMGSRSQNRLLEINFHTEGLLNYRPPFFLCVCVCVTVHVRVLPANYLASFKRNFALWILESFFITKRDKCVQPVYIHDTLFNIKKKKV